MIKDKIKKKSIKKMTQKIESIRLTRKIYDLGHETIISL